MRSIIHYHYGEPDQVLHLTEAPELARPGPGEVLIRVLARPIHPGDLLGVRGRYRAPGNEAPVGPDGARPGAEGMGVITALGTGIDPARGLAPGQRVAFFPVRWAWSDQVLAPARCVTRVPDDMPDAVAAQLHVAPLTAALLLRAVQATGAPPAAMVVLSAAASLVARLAARLLQDAGYGVAGVVRAPQSVAQLAALPVVSTAHPDWAKRLCALVRGRPVHVALDPVGGAVAGALVNLLADGGTLVSYGDLSGQPVTIPALAFSTRGIRIEGVSMGRWPAVADTQRAADIATAIALARAMPDAFRVAGTYNLYDIAAAVRHAELPGKGGAVLLVAKASP